MNLCNDDEAIENGDSQTDTAKSEAAANRIRTEYESYPATLANALTQGTCYEAALRGCKERKRLAIHVIGASEDAELSRGPTVKNRSPTAVCKDYAEALTELADQYNLQTIDISFIGPDCPSEPWDESVPLQNPEKELIIRTVQGLYSRKTLAGSNPADIVALFNPGLTCPDYSHWKETLESIPEGTPFLSTTNTEMEGLADCQFLLDQDKIQTLPAGLADLFGVYSEGEDVSNSFFAVNPFAGNRVRQNGTMANDLFVKNRWMLGGILGSFDPSANKASVSSKKLKGDGFNNMKSSNPALI